MDNNKQEPIENPSGKMSRAGTVTLIGRQIVDHFPRDQYWPANSWGWPTSALVWLPADLTKKYPAMIFLHGKGEAGSAKGGDATLSKLVGTSLPQLIAAGYSPDFIVCSPQADSWSYGYNELQYIVPAFLTKYKDNIDFSQVYIVGLSAGGQGVLSALTNDPWFASLFAAACALAPVALDSTKPESKNVAQVAKLGIPFWGIVGDADTEVTPVPVTNFVNTVNANQPGIKAMLTIIKGGTHSPNVWNSAVDPKVWPTHPDNPTKMSLQDWFLQFRSLTPFVPGQQPPTTAAPAQPTTQAPTTTKAPRKLIYSYRIDIYDNKDVVTTPLM